MTTDTPTATATRRYRQPVERVFAAWTTPALLERWYAPVAGWAAKDATVDAREGGGYRISFGPLPGADRYTETGEYLVFQPTELLRILIEVTGPEGASRSIAEVRFRRDGDWTEVEVSDAGHTDEAAAAQHAEGWQHSLDRLTDALATFAAALPAGESPSSAPRDATVEQVIPFPPADVWRALTHPELVAMWWARGDIAPVVGRAFTLDLDRWGAQRCTILVADEPTTLSYTFAEGVLDTTITWRLSAEGDGTRLTLVHAGFDTAKPIGRTGYEGMGAGWPAVLARIAAALLGAKDTIAASVEIDAPIEEVWRFVSEPGWWINDGRPESHEVTIERLADGTIVASVPRGDGIWRPIVVELRDNEYAAFRWIFHDRNNRDATAGVGSTLVEFTLTERDGRVVVDLLESGFAELPLAPERIVAEHGDNTEGWGIELGLLKQTVEALRP